MIWGTLDNEKIKSKEEDPVTYDCSTAYVVAPSYSGGRSAERVY
jgi:hypothetical protein